MRGIDPETAGYEPIVSWGCNKSLTDGEE